jgi:hypothetical protein
MERGDWPFSGTGSPWARKVDESQGKLLRIVEKDSQPKSYNFMKQESEELNCELGSGLHTTEKVEWKNMYHTSSVTSRYSKVS